MLRTIWRMIAVAALLLTLAGCAPDRAQSAATAGIPTQTPLPAPTPTPTATPAPLDGVWAVEMDGLRLTLTLYADGRFAAASTETAGTMKAAAVEGIYAVRDGDLCFQSGDAEYRCAADWTDAVLTIRQAGFSPLLLKRTEAKP